MVMIAAANMGPKANEDPERLDLQRHPNRHIAFGTGIHFCLGYQLALRKLCSGGGRNLRWRFSQQTSGGGNDLALGP
jgi:cytochrome P450